MGNSRFTPPFTQKQLRALVILPKITAIPSLIACTLIVQHVLRSKQRRRTVYHRLLLLMSIHDFLFALNQFIGTWMNPSEYKHVMWLAAGSTQTCTASGFFRHASLLTSVLYSGSLTSFFLLVVKFGWKERRIARRVEPFMHGVSLVLGWGMAIAGLGLDLYAPFAWGCGVVAFPPGCTQSYQATADNPATCLRGDNAAIYSWVIFVCWMWGIFLFNVIAMTIMYIQIKSVEQQQQPISERYEVSLSDNISNNKDNDNKHMLDEKTSPRPARLNLGRHNGRSREMSFASRRRSRQFAVQGILYCLFYLLTYLFGVVNITTINWGPEQPYMPLMLLQTCLGPLQGFFNFVVYARPRYLSYKKKYPEKSFGTVLCELWGCSGNKAATTTAAATAAVVPTRRRTPSRNIIFSDHPARMSSSPPRILITSEESGPDDAAITKPSDPTTEATTTKTATTAAADDDDDTDDALTNHDYLE